MYKCMYNVHMYNYVWCVCVCVIFTLNKCVFVLVYVKRYETDWLWDAGTVKCPVNIIIN